MRDFIAKISLTALFALAIFSASAAEKVTFEANSPLTVAAGEPFRVEFALNAKPDDDTFKAPSFEGFDVIAGPAFSQGSSIQIVNGQMTRSSNYTITYVLLPQQEGNFTIGAASVRVGKSQYKTKALPIEVVEETPEGSGGQQAVQGGQSADDVQQVSKDDILLRMILSRTTAFKGRSVRRSNSTTASTCGATTAASSRRSTASGHRRSSRTHSPSANATTARSTRRRSSRSICSTRSSRAN